LTAADDGTEAIEEREDSVSDSCCRDSGEKSGLQKSLGQNTDPDASVI
jgi:hypothetical protein